MMFSSLRYPLRQSARLGLHARRSLKTAADVQTNLSQVELPAIRRAAESNSKLTQRRDVYQLPVNSEEVTRLNNQHLLLKMLIGGNCTPQIKEHLSHLPGREKVVFDLGCGTGAWARDMATEFPHCTVIGADVAPMDLGIGLKNLKIETCDANQGLTLYRNEQFDFANTRLIAMGITNYPALVSEFFRVLKPGGFLQLQEWDFFAVDVEKRVIGTESWFGKWCSALRHGLAYRGAGVNAASGLNEMISEQGFGSVQQRDVWMPIGPCFPKDTADGARLNLVGEFMRENVKAFIKVGRALIIGSGMAPDEYDLLVYEATKEVQDISFPMFLRLHCVTARK